ncbi:hypothetical protein WN51_00087 [Melipona quadrifasciata]|uniref:Uncharacterized protein n=1 Tax=Melipona quadrifasciata TaxID=166423 RepID=A0A0M9ABN8_9HYME|nr:hypothetical protein WN51_00087 [Melipona quadrifasciata]
MIGNNSVINADLFHPLRIDTFFQRHIGTYTVQTHVRLLRSKFPRRNTSVAPNNLQWPGDHY